MEHILDHEKMDAMKALADTNIKISEAKGILFGLQEQETKYLETREKKAMDRIEKVVDESKKFLDEAKSNYTEIAEIGQGVTQVVSSLGSLLTVFEKVLNDFEERNVLWEKEIGQQQDDIAEMRKVSKIDRIQIENDKKSIEKDKERIKQAERKLKDERETLDRAINRLKEGKI